MALPNRTESVTQIPESSVLQPFVRRGVDGGCVLCRKPITDHIGHRGVWIGCAGQTALPPTIPFLLIPDRRRYTELRRAADVAQTPLRRLHDAPGATIVEPVALPPVQAPSASRASRVTYHVAPKAAKRTIAALPHSDARVYRALAARPVRGATRAQLLETLDTTERTGVVDGAIRRLRLKRLIVVRRTEAA